MPGLHSTSVLLFCNLRWHICLGDLVDQDRGACNVSITS